MSDESAGRPGQPGKPHRFYFDDLADEEAVAPVVPAAEPTAPAPPPVIQPTGDPELTDDDLADTGPIEVIRDPVLGSAAGQQLFFDDLAPMQHASGPLSPPIDAAPEDGEPSAADPEDAEQQPTRGALALAAARRPRPVGAVLAVVAVLALVGVLAAVGGHGHSGTKARDSAAVGAATSTDQQQTTASPTQTRSASLLPPKTSAVPSPTRRRSSVPAKAPGGIELTVLNNTIQSGLAKSAAQEFSTRGWQVGAVGNYAGQLNLTTVYYDVGNVAQQQAARTLAAQFPGVTQVQPRPAGLPGSGLTVVLAPDWHA